MNSVDRTLADRASRQHGLISIDQALHYGLSRRQVDGRLRAGQLERVGRGVYRMAGSPHSWRQQALAACMAAPGGALASHLTAAALRKTWSSPPSLPQITVPYGRSHRTAEALVHRARLGPADADLVDGIPTTTAPRMLVDCAGVLGRTELRTVVDAAFHQKLVSGPDVDHAWTLARLGPGRHGEVSLRRALDPWVGAVGAESPAEVRLLAQLRQWGYPDPALQIEVLGHDGATLGFMDLGWVDRRIGIEYDSDRWHGPERWEFDSARQQAIEQVGWRILRADKADLRAGERSLRDALSRLWPVRQPAS